MVMMMVVMMVVVMMARGGCSGCLSGGCCTMGMVRGRQRTMEPSQCRVLFRLMPVMAMTTYKQWLAEMTNQ